MEKGDVGQLVDGLLPAVVWDSYPAKEEGDVVRLAYRVGENGSSRFVKVDMPYSLLEQAGLPMCRGTTCLLDPARPAVGPYAESSAGDEAIAAIKDHLRSRLGIIFPGDPDYDSL